LAASPVAPAAARAFSSVVFSAGSPWATRAAFSFSASAFSRSSVTSASLPWSTPFWAMR
jgi:hypothetical protein